jgi:hypothetical protein
MGQKREAFAAASHRMAWKTSVHRSILIPLLMLAAGTGYAPAKAEKLAVTKLQTD